ncbi:hypothetical protein SDC9_197579 [bioreactor metagenome]|uniref:Uncharacterized protein n=1 Tax=bioreactor metagenome TaxID=1076179 RepID=A0A645IF89_9ZZZZ
MLGRCSVVIKLIDSQNKRFFALLQNSGDFFIVLVNTGFAVNYKNNYRGFLNSQLYLLINLGGNLSVGLIKFNTSCINQRKFPV